MDTLEITPEVDALRIAELTRTLNAAGLEPIILHHSEDKAFPKHFAEVCGGRDGQVGAQLVNFRSFPQLSRVSDTSNLIALTTEERAAFQVLQHTRELREDTRRRWEELDLAPHGSQRA